jgi:hypothetical protein
MKVALLLASLALGTVSASATEPESISGEVALGEKLQLGSIRIRPLRVIEDKRCPTDATCPGPHRIIVRTEVRGRSTNKVRDFEIGQIRQVERSSSLMLAAVTPPPATGTSIEPASYRFTYEFMR